MNEKMDRTDIRIGSGDVHDKDDASYWANAPVAEKLRTITYLRECFYGQEATTGRLHRVYSVFKRP